MPDKESKHDNTTRNCRSGGPTWKQEIVNIDPSELCQSVRCMPDSINRLGINESLVSKLSQIHLDKGHDIHKCVAQTFSSPAKEEYGDQEFAHFAEFLECMSNKDEKLQDNEKENHSQNLESDTEVSGGMNKKTSLKRKEAA